ncbi:TraB/GumN family protein [Bizionia myxarmorum]|uniref:TraB/GumN family protein n=1 Tax=Bizionia myxarmorum TaxID=291186 RepID=A0A5D0R5I8_9FLAO|nr:TraB/GumN family protein [Bizionia myxarmorum]TYB76166.1 TraB/GumN family protein [Bizionia myxarmorum]
MKFKYWIILLTVLPNVLCSQNYLDYYKGINTGKLLLADNQPEASLNSYYTTFENFHFVFARDCYNAIEIAAFAKDSLKLDYFIRRGIQQGLKWNQINRIENISRFQYADFLKEIEKEKDRLENSYKESINWEVRNMITEMFQQDQEIRERYYEAILFKRNKIGRDWETLNKKQVEKLIEITATYGFPGEKLIGIDTNQMHDKIANANMSAGMPIVLFIHHYSQPNQSYSALLLEQIKTGNLYNEHFATISDFEAAFGKNKFENFGYFAFKHKPKVINVMEINKRRTEIALPSLTDMGKLNRLTTITKFWNRLY